MELVHLVVALVLGLLAKRVRLPPLVGFLAAGFVLHALGYEATDALREIADLGVTLLLFTIGLKLRVRTLLSPPVWGGAVLQAVASVGLFVGLVLALAAFDYGPSADLDLTSVALVAFALSFSSTVFAVKVLEERGEGGSLHGNVTIGILVMQDLLAVLFIALTAGEPPSPWALALLLLIPLRPLLHRVLELAGHGEMLVLLGFVLAAGSYAGFDALGVKGDLGALFVGALIAGCPRADELAKSLFAIKDLLLVGFFLTIGMSGLPDGPALVTAGLLLLIVPIKAWVFFFLLTRFRLRTRTALFSSTTLANYSEFGLIVGYTGVELGLLRPDWLVVVAVALSITFVAGGPLRRWAEDAYTRHSAHLARYERPQRLAGDEPVDAGDAEVIVVGMGRVGTDAYDRVRATMGECVVGIESDPETVEAHESAGRRVFRGDASDVDFWETLVTRGRVRLVLLSMTSHEATYRTARNLRAVQQRLAVRDGAPLVAGIGEHDDELEALKAEGVDLTYDLLGEAGYGFVEHVRRELESRGQSWESCGGDEPRAG
jgi:predicted Kef-type K+ transport protein